MASFVYTEKGPLLFAFCEDMQDVSGQQIPIVSQRSKEICFPAFDGFCPLISEVEGVISVLPAVEEYRLPVTLDVDHNIRTHRGVKLLEHFVCHVSLGFLLRHFVPPIIGEIWRLTVLSSQTILMQIPQYTKWGCIDVSYN